MTSSSFQVLTTSPNHTEHKSFITVYKPIAGWKAVQYWWNPDMGGFWEPWQTAGYAFNTKENAIEDALNWAEAENIPFYVEGYIHKSPENQSQAPDYDPAQKAR